MKSIKQSQLKLFDEIGANQRIRNLPYTHPGSVHVAFLIKRGKIIAEASNKFGSRSSGSGYSDRSIHAERNVIKNVGDIRTIRGADMYVVRIARDNQKHSVSDFAGSKPCSGCALFLEKCMKEYGLKNVYYTSDFRE
jgi:hypothetical protein